MEREIAEQAGLDGKEKHIAAEQTSWQLLLSRGSTT